MDTHAIHRTRRSESPACTCRASRGGFTLTELLIVIGIIVILIGILLPALGRASAKARETQTRTTLNEFVKACEAFHQEFGYYPGIVSEEDLADSPIITSTQNAVLHLMGGALAQNQVDPGTYDAWLAQGAHEYTFPSGTTVAFLPEEVGRGPVLNGRHYPPFYNPKEREFMLDLESVSTSSDYLEDEGSWEVNGNSVPLRQIVPTIVDGWGSPVLYARQMRKTGPLVAFIEGNSPWRPQFAAEMFDTVTGYERLGRRAGEQEFMSIVHPGAYPSGTAEYPATIAQAIRSPTLGIWDSNSSAKEQAALQGSARGAIVMWSPGEDAIFFSKEDGPGSPSSPMTTLFQTSTFNPQVLEEYDDVIVFGGS